MPVSCGSTRSAGVRIEDLAAAVPLEGLHDVARPAGIADPAPLAAIALTCAGIGGGAGIDRNDSERRRPERRELAQIGRIDDSHRHGLPRREAWCRKVPCFRAALGLSVIDRASPRRLKPLVERLAEAVSARRTGRDQTDRAPALIGSGKPTPTCPKRDQRPAGDVVQRDAATPRLPAGYADQGETASERAGAIGPHDAARARKLDAAIPVVSEGIGELNGPCARESPTTLPLGECRGRREWDKGRQHRSNGKVPSEPGGCRSGQAARIRQRPSLPWVLVEA